MQVGFYPFENADWLSLLKANVTDLKMEVINDPVARV